MHKKSKKKAAAQKECISKSKKMQKEARKKKKKQNSSSKKQKQCKQMHMQNQISHTTFFVRFCCIVFAFLVRFFCILFALFLLCICFFFRFVFCVFSRKRTKNPIFKYKANKNAKAKTRTFLTAFVLLFDCIFFCIFCAFFVHFFYIFCAFFCIGLVDKCVFIAIVLRSFAFQGIQSYLLRRWDWVPRCHVRVQSY